MRRWIMGRSRLVEPRTSRLRWVAAVGVGAVALGSYGLVGAPAFASSKTSSAPKVTVKTKKINGLGTVYVDANGKTLYTLTNGGQAVACTGACATIWPPLLIGTGSTPKGAKGVTGLGSAAGQVTDAGLPLYRFAQDTKSGQANGEGISSFGGVWHVVKEAGTKSTTGGTKPSSGGGGGYGY